MQTQAGRHAQETIHGERCGGLRLSPPFPLRVFGGAHLGQANHPPNSKIAVSWDYFSGGPYLNELTERAVTR